MDIAREPFFLVLGRHDPLKNIIQVLKALSTLQCKEMELWFVGEQDIRYTPNLKKIAVDLGISHRCRWIPWVEDEIRLKILNSCQALVIASLWEGFGLPAIEAMACNTPVIASKEGALPEVVGEAGILVNPRETASISDAMRQIISNGLLRDHLVKKGQDRIKFYKWDKAARLVEAVLYSL